MKKIFDVKNTKSKSRVNSGKSIGDNYELAQHAKEAFYQIGGPLSTKAKAPKFLVSNS